MKFSEDGKKLIVGGKSNKQVDGTITFTWDDKVDQLINLNLLVALRLKILYGINLFQRR